MANNFQMAVRGGIMVVTMIAIPLLAIFGKQIPELIEGIYRGNTKTDQWQARPAQPGTANNLGANQFAGPTQRPGLTEAPAFQPHDAGSLNSAHSPTPKIEPPPLITNAFQTAQPLPLSPSINGTNNSSTLNPARSNNLGQALPPNTLRDPAVSPAASHTAPADLNSVAFQQGQQRLRDLGVHYFKLETTGEATERYRAKCELRTAVNAQAVEFSSLHTDPLAALNDIIAQVERARGGRGPELQAQRGMLR